MGRPEEFMALAADRKATYDEEVVIDLSSIEPLAAAPHMPDKMVRIKDLDGMSVDQAAIGSCTNSSYTDLKATAELLKGKRIDPATDLLIAPGSKQVLKLLTAGGLLDPLLDAGARILECACGPCIGIGGSPVSKGVCARTFNRNFEGRSGTQDAQVYLVSPLTAAQAALNGKFTDPATWGTPPKKAELPRNAPSIRQLFVFPPKDGSSVEVLRGPNIVALERFTDLPQTLAGKIVLKVGDNITTDHIMPAGAQIMALRSNIPAISEHVFTKVDPEFVARIRAEGGGFILGGENYGQGSSREHAALAPRHLGVKAVIVKSLARIHRANLVNFGILPLILVNKADYATLAQGASLSITVKDIQPGRPVDVLVDGAAKVQVTNDLTAHELEIIHSGGLLNTVRAS
jgi:aconitate hydratase